jgi:UDP-glucuronate 4-epimerase
MRTLVTGAAGFIGSRLAERLLDEGHAVRGIDRFSDFYEPARKRANADRLAGRDGFDLVEGDLCEIALDGALDGVEVVFHLAAQPGVRTSWGSEFDVYLHDNVLATQRLLEAARHGGVERVVFASSSSIYGDAERYPTSEESTPQPISPYGVTKLAGEHLCRLYGGQFGLHTVVLRYFTIFGPGQRPDMAFARFIEAALEGRPLEVFGDGRQERDFTYVDDAVAATIAAGERGGSGEVYNVAGGARASVLDVIDALHSALGRSLEARHEATAPGDVRQTGADTAKARRDLGFEPQVSLERGLRLQVEARTAGAAVAQDPVPGS